MKISHFSLGFALVVATVGFGYSLHTAARMRELEGRLQRAEAALQSGNQPFGRIESLEKRVHELELAPTRPMFISSASRPPVHYEDPAPNIEKKINPHPEPLPPFQPGN